ncbi:hypothetical protein ANANG_G00091410 [Anguilla anguilla]|uniref:Serine aminopeptidase S33 domain-containing protein n=1 Tax=Anguilla anguilla TaxID=7936 RepID=A0A9D3S1K3_ANGAN|nr:hypothetical protein ANANG_G00091410 [Anguilla anguilla]
MNGLPISELCCLFCCPPCPSRIAAKLAFLPPEPTYALLPDLEAGSVASGVSASGLRSRGGGGGAAGGGGGTSGESRWKLHLTERAEFQYSQRELEGSEVFLTRSSRGNRVACMYIRCAPAARYTVLFSHGNAVDLGQMSSFYIGLGTRINCNIFSYDYSGYGVSTGKPSEKNLYADIDAAWAGAAHTVRHQPGEHHPVRAEHRHRAHGGPGVAVRVRRRGAALPAHLRHEGGLPDTKKTYCFDAFPNIEKVSKITSPVLIIHGTEDEVIDFSHGLALFERCPKAVEPLWVEGAGHNDIELYSQYLERLRRFIGQELTAQHA